MVTGQCRALLLAVACGSATKLALAQSVSASNKQVLTVIDPSPIASPRADAMSGAITPVADDLDAAFHNPAGIGGLGHDQASLKRAPLVRKLYFPWITVGSNSNSVSLASEMKSKGATTDATVASAVLDANTGKRQYARVGASSGVVLGRTMCVPFTDMQVASTSRGPGTNILDTTYRSESGAGCGFSAQDSQSRLSLGYFGYQAQRSLTDGAIPYDDFTNASKAGQITKANTVKGSVVGHNAGLIWRLNTKASPTLGLSVINAGGAKFHTSSSTASSPTFATNTTGLDHQDTRLAFGLQPRFGKSSGVNFVIEADRIDDQDVALIKKYRIGSELLIGGFGSYATMAIRAGYSHAGPSGGIMINLGLIGLEASAYSTDVAADNHQVVERRAQTTLWINVAEF